jgi:hypothetical protein
MTRTWQIVLTIAAFAILVIMLIWSREPSVSERVAAWRWYGALRAREPKPRRRQSLLEPRRR